MHANRDAIQFYRVHIIPLLVFSSTWAMGCDPDTLEDSPSVLPEVSSECEEMLPTSLVFTVSDTADLADADLGDDLCASIDGTCTLRAAIQQANATAEPFTYIAVSAGEYNLSIAAGVASTDCTDSTCMIAEEEDAGMGDLDITSAMCVVGRDHEEVIVRGGGSVGRAFDIHSSASSAEFPGVVLADLTIEDSYAPAFDGPEPVYGMPIMEGCESGEDECSGGGIRNQGDLTLRFVTVQDSASQGNGNGILNTSAGTLLIHGSTIQDNVDQLGHGGGLANAGVLTVQYSTFAGNETDSSGGAITNLGGVVDIINSTFHDNTSAWGGSALDNSSDGEVTVLFSTLANNQSPNSGAAIYASSGEILVKNSIIADTSGDGCVEDGGTLVAMGDNLSTDGTCTGFTVGNADLQALSIDPSAETSTLPLGPASDALGAASACTDFVDVAVGVDQRGATRTSTVCDLGAHEL